MYLKDVLQESLDCTGSTLESIKIKSYADDRTWNSFGNIIQFYSIWS